MRKQNNANDKLKSISLASDLSQASAKECDKQLKTPETEFGKLQKNFIHSLRGRPAQMEVFRIEKKQKKEAPDEQESEILQREKIEIMFSKQ